MDIRLGDESGLNSLLDELNVVVASIKKGQAPVRKEQTIITKEMLNSNKKRIEFLEKQKKENEDLRTKMHKYSNCLAVTKRFRTGNKIQAYLVKNISRDSIELHNKLFNITIQAGESIKLNFVDFIHFASVPEVGFKFFNGRVEQLKKSVEHNTMEEFIHSLDFVPRRQN